MARSKNIPSSKSTETWLTNAWIVTQNEKRETRFGHLRIVDGRIAEIRSSLPSKLPKGAKVDDLNGLFVVPGFVQAHIHLCQTLFRNLADDLELMDWLSKRIWVMEAAHTPETLYWSAMLGIHELLRSGTTCLLDMGTVRHTDSIFKAVEKSGIRASVGKCLMDHPDTTPPYLREPTRDALDEANLLFKKWHGSRNDRIRVSYAPRFVLSCTEKLLLEVVRAAREQNTLIHTHASENLKEIQLVKELVGCENIEYLNQIQMTSPRTVLAHCIWLKPHEMELLAKSGTHVAHCPSSNLKLASGIARVPEMIDRGINVAIGADGAPCNNSLDIFHEMRLAATIQKPQNGPTCMPAQTALDLATRNGAKALGWFDDIGSIEVGKKADFAVLDLQAPENHLSMAAIKGKTASSSAVASAIVYASQPEHVKRTYVDGKLVMKDGQVLAIPRSELLKNVRASQAKILKVVDKA